MKEELILLPCPYCKSRNVDVCLLDSFLFYVSCLNDGCNAEGPKRDSEGEAIEAWNNVWGLVNWKDV